MKVLFLLSLLTVFSLEARTSNKDALSLSLLRHPTTFHFHNADSLQSLNLLWVVQMNSFMTVLNERLKVDLITGQQNQKVMSFYLQSLTF